MIDRMGVNGGFSELTLKLKQNLALVRLLTPSKIVVEFKKQEKTCLSFEDI